MSLDELRKKQEELRLQKAREEEERKKKREDAKKRQKERKTDVNSIQRTSSGARSGDLQGNIGSFSISFTQELLNSLLQKIWYVDSLENTSVDNQLITYLQTHPSEFDLRIDTQSMLNKARKHVFFVTNNGDRIPYDEFRQRWMDFWQELTYEYTPKRKEFVQLLTNRFKNRWVDQDGHHLSEEIFQLLYRMEREPRAVERLLGFTQSNLIEVIPERDLRTFITRIRALVSKTIKEDLLNLLELTKTAPENKKNFLSRVKKYDLDDDEEENDEEEA
jgi:hypothetical protein